MRTQSRWFASMPLVACISLAAWLAWSSLPAARIGFAALGFALLYLIVYTDAIDFAIRRFVHRRNLAARAESARGEFADVSIDLSTAITSNSHPGWAQPYAIVASIFNLEDQVDSFATAFAGHRGHTWLISDGSTDDTVRRFRQEGWRCLDDSVNRGKPGALRRLIATLPAEVETVMVIDPDVRIREPGQGSAVSLDRVIRDFQQTGAAAAAPRIMIERDGFLGRFQAFEYALATGVGRLSLGDVAVTSGVAIYRRDALERALGEHSLSVYAEDFENTVLLLRRGERIYYDGRLVVSTDGAGTWRRWFSQRVGWYFGLLKVYVERLDSIWAVAHRTPFAMYNYVAYLGVLALVLHVVRVVSAALLVVSLARGSFDLLGFSGPEHSALASPPALAIAMSAYLALGAFALLTVVPAAERAYAAPIVPLYLFYAIAHVAPMTVGFANWVALRYFGRRLYLDHYATNPRLRQAVRAEDIAERNQS